MRVTAANTYVERPSALAVIETQDPDCAAGEFANDHEKCEVRNVGVCAPRSASSCYCCS